MQGKTMQYFQLCDGGGDNLKEIRYKDKLQYNLEMFIETKDIKYYNNLKEINKLCWGINRCTNNVLYDFYDLYLATKGVIE